MLDINVYMIIGQVLTFLAGLAILWRIAYRPVVRIFKQRADKIGADLEAAEKARRDMEKIKADYDAQDSAYQKLRQQLNERIATAKRSGAPEAEVAKIVEESERLSREHAQKMDAYLASSKFVGVVGVFEGAGYSAKGLYRPMLDCLMFTKGDKPLCRVCQAAVERRIAHFSE